MGDVDWGLVLPMETISVVIASLSALFVAICLPMALSSKAWKGEEDRARARRLAEARMEARLLRFHL